MVNTHTGIAIKRNEAGLWCLIPVILATWEAKIRRIMVQGQPWQIVQEIPTPKQPKQNGLEVHGSVKP
jgi:hypothetical protein